MGLWNGIHPIPFLINDRYPQIHELGIAPDCRELMKESIIIKMREEGLKLTPQRLALKKKTLPVI